MKSIVLGYPRIGEKRELKKAIESFWNGKSSECDMLDISKTIRQNNWTLQNELDIDLISSNDFSLYDQMLDMCITLGCIPKRFKSLKGIPQYFAMARGLQNDSVDVTAMEMTKWFDTNYHYIVPEFVKNQQFSLNADKIINEYNDALELGIQTKPVIIGPVTFLLLGKEKENGFNRIDLIADLLPIYEELIRKLDDLGVEYLQIDEPILATELSLHEQLAISFTYERLKQQTSKTKIVLANYFDCYGTNINIALKLPVDILHLDLVRCHKQLDDILEHNALQEHTILSLGLVDGRNIWKNDFEHSLKLINKAKKVVGIDRIWIGTSCSLLHCPYNLELEDYTTKLTKNITQWLAFSKQKLKEIAVLKTLVINPDDNVKDIYRLNLKTNNNRTSSPLIHNPNVKQKVANLTPLDGQRNSEFSIRQQLQKNTLQLPLFPTTTIGSFPQTKDVRSIRAKFKKGHISEEEYQHFIAEETTETIRFQEDIGLDVLVHGEFERNDMVEYFGEQLNGFAFTKFGWVQSYGTRCVKPPIIYGDVSRPQPMTVKWSSFAQSITKKPVKGMLTGPVTLLQWSFVRNDQPRATTCKQIALAIRNEVIDLEQAGLKVIQIDEPAIREGLPLRKSDWASYLSWAINAFKISASAVKDDTQIHTHMCYSEFNDIIKYIAKMDADVITIETSRSEMELLEAFVNFKYPNEIGPGVYDIHSPRIPTEIEIENLLDKACNLIPTKNLWVNPDCGLKTRDWPETKSALINLVNSAKHLREKHAELV